jgi:hypothetical protein
VKLQQKNIEKTIEEERGEEGFQVNLNKLNLNSAIPSKRVLVASVYNQDYIPREYSHSPMKNKEGDSQVTMIIQSTVADS